MVETIAAVHTLRFCKEIGLTKICIEGNAKNVVNALLQTGGNWSKVRHLVVDAQLLVQTFT
jgi:ribonuclease HI